MNWRRIQWLGAPLSRVEGLRRTFVFAYVATAVSQICEIGYNYLLYRHFPVGEIGLLSWASALIVFFGVAVDLGVEPILIRRFASSSLPLRQALLATLLPRLPIVLVGALVLAVFWHLRILNDVECLLLLLIGAQLAFNVTDSALRAWLRANGRQTVTNMVTAYLAVLKLALIAMLAARPGSTIPQVMGGLLLIRATGTFTSFRLASAVGSSREPGQPEALAQVTRSLLRAGVVIGAISGLTAVQNRLDWLLVSRLVSGEALASYSLANKLYEISQVFIGVAITTLYPRLCRDASPGGSIYSLVLRGVIFIGVTLATVGMLTAPPLIDTLFAGKYAGIALPAHLMMVAVGFMAATGVFYNLILSRGLDKSLLKITVITTAIQAGCNFLLIPRIGMDGAAIGMLVLLLATTAGLAYVTHLNRLLSGRMLSRVLVFLVVFPIAPGLSVVLSVPLSVALPVCLAVNGASAWWVLFAAPERQALWRQLRQGKHGLQLRP
jgi:O-antigen/teichoic acid export membrane protein